MARRGDDYWFDPGGTAAPEAPDAWMFYGGRYPAPEDADGFGAFVEDLLAEMEAMAGGSDRCRWPLDAPWPHTH